MGAFLDRVAGRSPTPGGGALAALAAALASALSRMALAYSSQTDAPIEERHQVAELASNLARLDGACRGLIDEDPAAYEAFTAAARQARQDPARRPAFQEAARLAVSVPLETAAMSVSLLRLLDEHRERFKKTLRSDLAVAAHLALAACRSARETALINIFELDDEELRRRLYEQCDHYAAVADELSGRIISFVHP